MKAQTDPLRNDPYRKTLENHVRVNTCKLRVFKLALGIAAAFSARLRVDG
jgi:hypothetical protein